MQHINLYLPEFHPNRDPLRAIQMLWGLVVVILLLMLATFYSHRQHSLLQQQLVQLEASQQALLAQLQKLGKQKPALAGPELDTEIKRLRMELQRREQITAMISSRHLGNEKGFSAQLTAFARASLTDISLETFSLQKGGTYAELTGKTRSADQVPHFLQRLRADPSFEKVGFGVLNIEQDEQQSGLLKFSLNKAGDRSETENGSPGGDKSTSNKADAIWNQAIRKSAEKDAIWEKQR
jgi:Tfp pilus assembly protein PilN